MPASTTPWRRHDRRLTAVPSPPLGAFGNDWRIRGKKGRSSALKFGAESVVHLRRNAKRANRLARQRNRSPSLRIARVERGPTRVVGRRGRGLLAPRGSGWRCRSCSLPWRDRAQWLAATFAALPASDCRAIPAFRVAGRGDRTMFLVWNRAAGRRTAPLAYQKEGSGFLRTFRKEKRNSKRKLNVSFQVWSTISIRRGI